MGSDLYMEAQSYRPRPLRVFWEDEKTLVIEKDRFYKGYETLYRGALNDYAKGILDSHGVDFPPSYLEIVSGLPALAQEVKELEADARKTYAKYQKAAKRLTSRRAQLDRWRSMVKKS